MRRKILEGDGIVGRSELITTTQQMMNKIAPSDATVLITGESGTGKELVARAIHARSSRSDREFIPVDCGALCAQIMESELFGHVRGAFTGALAEKPGLVESARGVPCSWTRSEIWMRPPSRRSSVFWNAASTDRLEG